MSACVEAHEKYRARERTGRAREEDARGRTGRAMEIDTRGSTGRERERDTRGEKELHERIFGRFARLINS